MKESVELAPLEAKEDSIPFAATVAPTLKPESKIDREEKITKLLEEIEAIKIANSKVADAKLREIPLEAVADDISMAGQSIEERQAAIQHLKHEGSSKKHWWQKAAVIGGILLTGLFAAKEASGQKVGDKKIKTKIENISQSKEKQKEDFKLYLDYLKEKSDTGRVSPDDMDMYVKKWELTGGHLDSVIQKEKFDVLNRLYKNSSPYAVNGKKVKIENLIPGWDLEFGFDKEERILLNKVLTEIPFDFSKIEEISKENFGYGEVLSDFSLIQKIPFKDKIIDIDFTSTGVLHTLWLRILDNDGKNIAGLVIGSRQVSVDKTDHSKFETEFTKLLEQK